MNSHEFFATTTDVVPGAESMGDDGILTVKGQVFVDQMESNDPTLAGKNRLVIDLSMNPKEGSGSLAGTMELTLDAGGSWVGELTGVVIGGMVTSSGLAKGTGPFEGKVARFDWQQVEAHPGTPSVAEPKAFFEVRAAML